MRLSPGVLVSRAAYVTSASATMSSALRAQRGRGSEQWLRDGGTKYGERKRKEWGGEGARGVAASETQWEHHRGAAAEQRRRRTKHPLIAFSLGKKQPFWNIERVLLLNTISAVYCGDTRPESKQSRTEESSVESRRKAFQDLGQRPWLRWWRRARRSVSPINSNRNQVPSANFCPAVAEQVPHLGGVQPSQSSVWTFPASALQLASSTTVRIMMLNMYYYIVFFFLAVNMWNVCLLLKCIFKFVSGCWNRSDNVKKKKKKPICVYPPSCCFIHLSCCCYEKPPHTGRCSEIFMGETGVVVVAIPRLKSSKFCHTALPRINEIFKWIKRGTIVNELCILSGFFFIDTAAVTMTVTGACRYLLFFKWVFQIILLTTFHVLKTFHCYIYLNSILIGKWLT